MTDGVKPLHPVLPTLLTRDVESVMPSRFYSSIKFFAANEDAKKKAEKGPAQSKTENKGNGDEDNYGSRSPGLAAV